MTYAAGRLCYDADSHIMELPDFFKEFADDALRDALPELNTVAGSRIGPMIEAYAKTKKHSAEEIAAQVALGDKLVTGPKGYQALGAFDRDERGQVLDLLGFSKQLVFSTFAAGTVFRKIAGSVELQYAAARAHNRAMAHFCDADSRLMGIAALPLVSVA